MTLALKQLYFFARYLICVPFIIICLVKFQISLAIKTVVSAQTASAWLDEKLGRDARLMLSVVAMFLQIKITTYGIEKICTSRLKTPMLIICNHQSLLDILALNHYFSKIPIRYILKQTLTRGFPYISAVVRIQRQAAIDRNNPKQSIQEVKRLASYSKRTGASIVVFPEGTRSRDGKLLAFKTAAIKTILRKNPLPVAVVALHNVHVFPTLTCYTYFEPANYYVRLLHVFPPVQSNDIPNIIEQSYALIEAQLHEWDAIAHAKT